MTEGEEPPRLQTVCLSHVVHSTWSSSRDTSGPESTSEGDGAQRRQWSCSLLDLYAGISEEVNSLFTTQSCNVGVLPTLENAFEPDSRSNCLFLSRESDPSAVGHAVVGLLVFECFTSKVLHLTSRSWSTISAASLILRAAVNFR